MAWIAGVGLTPFGRQPGMTALEWQTRAALQTMDDAGVTRREVDGVLVGYATTLGHLMPANLLAEHLGLRPEIAFGMSAGGATGLAMVAQAAHLVDAGAASCVLVVAGEDRASGQSTDTSMRTLSQVGHRESEVPVGATVPAYYALLASAYLHRHGLGPNSLAPLAVQMREHATLHPGAHFRTPIAVEDVLASPAVADPLRLLDCCPVSDGGAAVVVVPESRSPRDLRIAGLGQAHRHQHLSEADLGDTGARRSASAALARASIGVEDIGIAGIYDSFTITLALLLEEIGLAAPGQAGRLADEGRFGHRGEMPVNTHGGLLSYGHSGVAGGMAHLAEVVRQLRGEAEDRQLERPLRWGFVHADGGVMSAHVSAVLEAAGAREAGRTRTPQAAAASPAPGTSGHDDPAQPADWTEGVPALLVSSCGACQHRWYFPRGFCPVCGSDDVHRSRSLGAGSVVAVSTVHRFPTSGGGGQAPFAIALVDLDDGVRVLGRCGLDTRVGDRVVARFGGDDAAVTLRPFFSTSAAPA